MAFQKGRSSARRQSSNGAAGKPQERPFSADTAKPQPSAEKLEQRARNVLLHQLARSAKSKHQLRQILEQREIPPEIAEAILERFTEVGLIDDKVFAQTIVSSRRNFRGLSKTAIKRELLTKGVAEADFEAALDEVSSEDELETAKELASKRFGQMAHLEKATRDRRLAGYLQRKGYSSAIAFAAIRFAENQELNPSLPLK